MRKSVFRVWTRPDTNRAVQPQIEKMARGLKFRILKVEGLYYLCSKNTGTYQLSRNCSCLRLCFSDMQKAGFLTMQLNYPLFSLSGLLNYHGHEVWLLLLHVLLLKIFEPCHEKFNNLHMRKQRRRSALR